VYVHGKRLNQPQIPDNGSGSNPVRSPDGKGKAAQGDIIQQQTGDALDVPARGGQGTDDARGGGELSRQVFSMFFDHDLLTGRSSRRV
jgi:hypothetical protein